MSQSTIVTLIGVIFLLLVYIASIYYSSVLLMDYKERIAEDELKAIASNIVSQIIEATIYANKISGDGEVLIKIQMPDECTLGHYKVVLQKENGIPILKLLPITRSRPVIRVALPVSTNAFIIINSTVYSGVKWNYIKVLKVANVLELELVYKGG